MATAKTTENKPLPTVQEIAEGLKTRFIECAAAAANEADVNQVMNAVIKDLNAAKREVTLKMMGLDNRWGKWEVDHCNGRNSPITQYLNEEHNAIVRGWVQATVKEVLTEQFEAKMRKQIHDAVRSELLEINGYKMRDKVREEVAQIHGRILKSVVDELRHELELPEA